MFGMKLPISLLVSAILLSAAVVTGIWIGLKNTSTPSGATVVAAVQTLSHLVTVKYVMEKVVVKETDRPFYNDKILLIAHGAVTAGIDVGKLKEGDVVVSGKDISIRLPDTQVMEAFLDEGHTRVYDRATGLPFRMSKSLESDARRDAVAQMRAAAHAQGINREAANRARELIIKLAQQMGFQNVEVITKAR